MFWCEKIARNTARDKEVNGELRKRGCKVVRIWEHEITNKHRPRLLYRLRRNGLLA